MNYYNEFDPKAAAWLRQLIIAGEIPLGDVDERSIEDVRPDELAKYTQCHFFAGIGGWPLALRLAGVPDTTPLWTGSCPCQPFSTAGKGGGFADERHLWPSWAWLISVCRPPILFGEQVAAKAVEPWIDLVHADLEAMGYAFGCVPFPSAGVGAPHIRDRAYWVGDASGRGRLERENGAGSHAERMGQAGGFKIEPSETGGRSSFLANTERDKEHKEQQGSAETQGERSTNSSGGCRMDDDHGPAGPTNAYWGPADWLFCRDGKWRPVEPGTFPLAHGVSARVGRLRGYGNAINAVQAAEFVMSATPWLCLPAAPESQKRGEA